MSSYSASLQIKAIGFCTLVLAGFYGLDNLIGQEPYFRKIEDYLQFVTPLYTFTIAFLHNDFKKSFKQIIISLTSVMAVVYSLKYFINAKRPNGIGGYSFPSGHTSLAFAASAIIHKRYCLYYAIPAYINSTLIGFLRVFHEKHYVIDVVCGAIIGVFIAWKMVSKKG